MAIDLEEVGRKGAPKDDKFQDTIPRGSAEQAMLRKIDELTAQIAALTAKMDVDFTAQNAAVTSSQLDVDYASSISDSISKIKLKP